MRLPAYTAVVLMGRKRNKIVVVNDRMQKVYRYELVAAVGRDFRPDFRPELTPKEMLSLGVFCGKYMTDCKEEFPADWFTRAKLSPDRRDCSQNYFGVNASQPLSVWRKKGWIHPADPRGWFQWYCRYYMGRRMPEEDARQIRRWKAIRRHMANGRPFAATWRRSDATASAAIRPAARDSGKHCCIGPMTAGKSEWTLERPQHRV